MLKHIVFFNFKDTAEGAGKEENMAKAQAMLEGLRGRVPTLLSMSAGPNAVSGASAWDFALIAEFADEKALKEYVDHPEHQKVSAFMSKVRKDRASVDFKI